MTHRSRTAAQLSEGESKFARNAVQEAAANIYSKKSNKFEPMSESSFIINMVGDIACSVRESTHKQYPVVVAIQMKIANRGIWELLW